MLCRRLVNHHAIVFEREEAMSDSFGYIKDPVVFCRQLHRGSHSEVCAMAKIHNDIQHPASDAINQLVVVERRSLEMHTTQNIFPGC